MEITLKADGWHRKLHNFVFGTNTPRYNNLCPYFWLTVFCGIITFIIPIIPIWKILRWSFFVLLSIFDWISVKIDLYVFEPLFERMSRSMDEEEILKSWVAEAYYNNNIFTI